MNREIKINNRGISPLIATVLLIVIAITIFGVIFMWLRGMISENVQKFDTPIASQCSNIVFSATAEGNKTFIDNKGNIPILGMNIKIRTADGKTLTRSIRKPVDGVISPLEIDEIAVDSSASFPFENALERTVTPVIQGKGVTSGKIVNYICQDKGVEV